jgi:hypothetical protein
MRKRNVIDNSYKIEYLWSRMSLTGLSTSGLVLAPIVSFHQVDLARDDDPGGNDPLPEPEPPPPPYPGPDPPLGWPPIPPSGPVGPGH